jgi:hypothetical protein
MVSIQSDLFDRVPAPIVPSNRETQAVCLAKNSSVFGFQPPYVISDRRMSVGRSRVATVGPNPSLMLGKAGIGMHFLRLHAPDALSPLPIVTG